MTSEHKTAMWWHGITASAALSAVLTAGIMYERTDANTKRIAVMEPEITSVTEQLYELRGENRAAHTAIESRLADLTSELRRQGNLPNRTP